MPRARPTSPSAVEVYAEADARASQVHNVALVVRELEAEVPQGNRPSQVDHVVLVGIGFHDVSHALLADDLGDDVVAQRADRVRGVGQAAAAEIQLVVGVHLHEGEDLAAALQEAGAQQVVDALGPAGGGARRIGAAAGELGAQLLVVQDEAVAVVRHGDLVSGLAVDGAREVAADPRGQARAGVGARRELRPIQSAEGGVFPVQVGAAVGAQKCICHSDLKDAESRGALCRCTVSPMSNSKSSSRPAALSIQIVVIAFFLLPNHRPAGPGTLAAEYVESAEICCAQGCGCCHCCCIQGGLEGS